MNITATMSAFKADLADRREAQRRRRLLEREIAAFVTPAERLELDLILARHSADEAREVHEVLDRQALQRAHGGYGTPLGS